MLGGGGTEASRSGTGHHPPGVMPPTHSLQRILTVSAAGTGSLAQPTLSTTAATAASMAMVIPSSPTPTPTTSARSVAHGTGANASVLCNLLPTLGQSRESAATTGIYVGEPVPAKLAEKITHWEFVEMAELLPEFWASPAPKESGSNPGTKQGTSRRRRAVTDIATWIQCFATYVSVMSTTHPQNCSGAARLPYFHPTDQPGLWGHCMGDVRCSIQTAGIYHRQQGVLEGQPLPVLHLLRRGGMHTYTL